MNVEVQIREEPRVPLPSGAHGISWSFILDSIFADAFHAELASLTLIAPSHAVADEIAQRRSMTPRRHDLRGHGVALLAGGTAFPYATRTYVLRFGMLAGPRLWALNALPCTAGDCMQSVYTWQALLTGLPIGLSHRIRRPDLHDRALHALRAAFASDRCVPAYFHLCVSRSEAVDVPEGHPTRHVDGGVGRERTQR